MCSWARLNP